VEDIYDFIDNNKLTEISEKEVKTILLDNYDEESTKKIFSCFK
jgi:hypothetical protein